MRRAACCALVLCGVLTVACRKRESGHEHASEHPSGHDHHEPGHGHGETPMFRLTAWSDEFEVFAEHPVLVRDKQAKLLVHVTALDRFRPVSAGPVVLELEGPATLNARSERPVQRGTFELELTPPTSGSYRARVRIGKDAAVVALPDLLVHDSVAKAPEPPADEHSENAIEFLKEQQWGVPFATAPVVLGALSDSIQVSGTIDTPPGGTAEVGAPLAGRVVVPSEGLVHPGDTVKKGRLLALLAPAPASPEEAARASLVQAEADARLSAARAAAQRAERLVKDEAAPARELDEARRELEVAERAVEAARRSAQIFAGARSGAGAGSWRLTSPIAGTVVDVKARPGASASPGELLFRIVDLRQLWLRARVPERDMPRVHSDRGVSFQVSGAERWTALELTGDEPSARLVSVGRTVDSVSRTVEIIYALDAPSPELRPGALAKVSLPVGEAVSGVIVPRGALVDDAGRSVLFVQTDGEHFERRTVRVGASAGERVVIPDGLAAGERVVVRGAHFVRLAAERGTSEPHGHVH